MHFHLESSLNAECDCPITTLSWMGRVPDEMPENLNGWKLNRMFYYQEGWLAAGTQRGVVGVTYTTSQTKTVPVIPTRTNYNLRGHRGDIILVKWNEPYQKLATCDKSGIIFVWVKFEGRWSIELINDRCICVSHFEWSHDGKMALICYKDGFVLVGSVSGQRYWSSILNLTTITAGVFSPDDQQVLLATADGLLVVMDVHGVTQSEELLLDGVAIKCLLWSGPKFKMEDSEEHKKKPSHKLHPLLTVVFQTGLIYLMKNYDDSSPTVIETDLNDVNVEWNVTGEILVVSGHTCDGTSSPKSSTTLNNILKFYTRMGTLRYVFQLPYNDSPVSGLAWGHHDKRLFISVGTRICIGRITRKISSLTLLCRVAVHKLVPNPKDLALLPIPKRVRTVVSYLYSQTFRCYLPTPKTLMEFTTKPPPEGKRLHCTMIRHDHDPSQPNAVYFTLYIEYLGGLTPLLKGKRKSMLRPEFVIFDPEEDDEIPFDMEDGTLQDPSPDNEEPLLSDSTESGPEDTCISPLRRSRKKKKKISTEEAPADEYEYLYQDLLPEKRKIAEVTSNIWGTKFKLHGLHSSLPCNLGQITYKTSLLHLQPRQMSLIITELRDDIPPRSDPTFNPNSFSEDEDEQEKLQRPRDLKTNTPPIAPLTPRREHSSYSSQDLLSPVAGPWDVPKCTRELASKKSSTKWDDHSYVDLCNPDVDTFNSRLKPHKKSSEEKKRRTHVQSPLAARKDTTSGPSNKSPSPSKLRPIHNPSCSNQADSSSSSSDYRSSYCRKPSPLRIDVRKGPYGMKSDQILRYIDDESGDSDVLSSTPSPIHRLHDKSRERSKSVGHLLNIDEHSSKTLNTHSSHLHQLTSMEAFMTFRRSLSLKDCKKQRQIVAEVDQPRLIDFGKSHSLDSSLLMLDCKSVSLTGNSPNNKLYNNIENNKHSSTIHGSPNRMHVIRNPSHSSHIYENINIYASSFGKSHKKERSSPQHSKNDKKQVKTQQSPRSLVTQLQKNSINATKHGSTPSSPKHALHCPSTPPTASRLTDNRFIRGLKEVVMGETFVSLYRDCSSPQSSGSASPDNSRKTTSRPSVASQHASRSSPSTPSKSRKHRRHQSASPVRCDSPSKGWDFEWRNIFSSPLLSRRRQRREPVESSDDEGANCPSEQDPLLSSNFSNLENFQKTQLKNKLRRNRGRDTIRKPNSRCVVTPVTPKPKKFFMQNKAPIWNEYSQVYQLDFGGRVTQESAKNFQIEFKGKQVMQFGRIDTLSYTLDFQYPFSAVQAFSVALANVTQRLK